jgi:8-oxo-dGTP pyrophosphatase MutT (NUDIX family)
MKGLREQIGHGLLLMPAVAVLAWDGEGRLLLVREAETGLWQTVGGAVEPDESPLDAAVRETAEEAGVEVAIDRLRAVTGGPEFRLRYPNGDLVSYVSIVFDAHIAAGTPHPDGDETIAVAWFTVAELEDAELTDFTRSLLSDPAVAVLGEQTNRV